MIVALRPKEDLRKSIHFGRSIVLNRRNTMETHSFETKQTRAQRRTNFVVYTVLGAMFGAVMMVGMFG